MAELLRALIALAVVGLLARAAPTAWRHRSLAVTVWRRIRLHHVLGCLLLLGVVLSVLGALLAFVPGMDLGVGRLVGLSGNAVFAPVEETVARTEPGLGGTAGRTSWLVQAGISAFLLALLSLLPWLAYVEERVFREGLEHAGLGREVTTAVRFGLVHLVMLIPVAAALAIAVVGFVYGRIYRHSYAAARGRAIPEIGLFGVPLVTVPARRARDEAVLTATVWHTTFNSMVVLIVLAGFLSVGL